MPTLRNLIEMMRRATKVSEGEVEEDSVLDIINEELVAICAEFSMGARQSGTATDYQVDLTIYPYEVFVDGTKYDHRSVSDMQEAVNDEL